MPLGCYEKSPRTSYYKCVQYGTRTSAFLASLFGKLWTFLNINVGPNLGDRTNLGGGLFMRLVSGATISGNTLSNQENGMDLYFVTGSTVTANNASSNTGWGIHLYASTGNVVSGNTCDDCIRFGRTNPGSYLPSAINVLKSPTSYSSVMHVSATGLSWRCSKRRRHRFPLPCLVIPRSSLKSTITLRPRGRFGGGQRPTLTGPIAGAAQDFIGA